ncbi:class F sortase [Yinghuangia sp. YIM S10712]|uniref:class F sortase n=1 Tax=Yinghuangia sp. YIM S10712 TaxID=3436930 RepID=UPI003F53DB26
MTVAAVLAAILAGIVVTADGMQPRGGPPQPAAAASPDPVPLATPAAERSPVAPGPTAAPPPAGQVPPGAPPGTETPPPPPLPTPTVTGPEPMRPSSPMVIEIRSIGVYAKLSRVGLTDKGWIDAPPSSERNLAAWYEGSPTPGVVGTSVIVGHVDVPAGPAVFYDLGTLRKGATIRIAREDGSTAVFTVYGVQVFSKKEFPAERVYGGTGVPELRVITCGGTYDKDDGYSGNVVAFARFTGRE